MFVDIYLREKSHCFEDLHSICKRVSIYQREEQHPRSLCEQQLKQSSSLVLWKEEELEQIEELTWAKMYGVPVFFLTRIQETENNLHTKEFTRSKVSNYHCYEYHNNFSLSNAMKEIKEILEKKKEEKTEQLLSRKSDFISFSFGDMKKVDYVGQCFRGEQPWGYGVFSVEQEGLPLWICCGNWHFQQNGDYFAHHGVIYLEKVEKESLIYKGDFFLTKEGKFLFMDREACCYDHGKLLYRGGIYGNSLEDYCLQGELLKGDEKFSGYFGIQGEKLYGTISQDAQVLYQGSYEKMQKEGFGSAILGDGQTYQGMFRGDDFCGQGVIEYEVDGELIKITGILPRESDYFLNISHITSSDGKNILATASGVSFPFQGTLKINYNSGIRYEGDMKGCVKTSGIFRQGEKSWEIQGNYDALDVEMLYELLKQLDEEEKLYLLAFAHCPQEQILDYHISLCQYLQTLYHTFEKKSVKFPEVEEYPYDSPDFATHLEAYLKLKASQRIRLGVYALEAIEEHLQKVVESKDVEPTLVIGYL